MTHNPQINPHSFHFPLISSNQISTMADIETSHHSRQEIQSAIAKAEELRALHNALLMQQQANSPAKLRFPSASPVSSLHTHHPSAQDYPVFTPTYDDEPLPGYHQILPENRNYSRSWGEHTLDGNYDKTMSDYGILNASSRKGLASGVMNLEEGHVCPVEDQHSVSGSCSSNIANGLGASSPTPGIDSVRPRRNSMGDVRTSSSCNKCKPAIISSESDSINKRKSNIVVPLTDSHSSLHAHTKHKGLSFARLFPRLKKKNKNENPLSHPQTEEITQVLKDLGMASVEMLKRELAEANERRDAALVEVAETKSLIGELSQKLEYLEVYCEELKRALQQSQPVEKLTNLQKRGKLVDGNAAAAMPVSEEVMVEGFLQIVSEARLSAKQFCKTLVEQMEETDRNLVENLNSLLQPYKLSLNSKYSKAVLYHLEAIINQSLYQDFENSVFQRNGAPKFLDPQEDRQARFQSFVALRNLSWNEVLRKGTKYYSDEFSKFCDQKMSGIIATLGWTRSWPEQLLQAFFVAAKCIWLLHLLAFSFSRPLDILRVDENMPFEPNYMEDISGDRQGSQGPSRVKIMVTPGFHVVDRVLRCKVLCRYKSGS